MSRNKTKFIWILDRYYFDGLIDISCAFKDDSIITSGYLYKIFQFILPKPMITILLDITPEITKIRKPEEQLNYEYINLLNERDIKSAINKNILDSAVLLCSEPTSEKCHRRLAAEYLQIIYKDIEIVHL